MEQKNNLPEYSEQHLIFHPYNVLMVLTIVSLSILFLSLTAAFTYTRVSNGLPPIKLPVIFILNTIVLLGSSYTMYLAKKYYLEDRTEKYQNALLATIIISLLFMVFQVIGWQILFNQNIFIDTNNSAGYLYVISGLHFAHIIAGLPFLILFLKTAKKKMKSPVSVLIYFSDPEKRLKLRLLTLYWHFLDGLWVYLILFFVINNLIQ